MRSTFSRPLANSPSTVALEEVKSHAKVTSIDPWFLYQLKEINDMQLELEKHPMDSIPTEVLRDAKRMGFSDGRLAAVWRLNDKGAQEKVRHLRKKHGVMPVYKRVDTCAAEFESYTPYLYSTYEEEDEAAPTPKKKVIILGSGPNRIGQGIEFDYCCCHAAFALREEYLETVMINCNPETVSTDYDTADRLYFQPLTFEDVMGAIETERAAGGEVSCLVQFGGQTPLKLSLALQEAGVRILGTSPDSIDLAEDRRSILNPKLVQCFSFERAARDDALCFGTINDFPRLANALVRWQVLAEQARQFSPAPDSFHEDWLKGEGTTDFGFRVSGFGFQICKFVGRFCETPFILASDTDALQDECEFS